METYTYVNVYTDKVASPGLKRAKGGFFDEACCENIDIITTIIGIIDTATMVRILRI